MKYVAFVELIDKRDLAFVARAVSRDDNLPQLWYMKIAEEDGGLLAVATDGKRLHKAAFTEKEAAGLSPGFWRVLKNKAVWERDFEAEDEMGVINDFGEHKIYEKKHVLWLAKLDAFDLFPADDKIDRIFPYHPTQQGAVNTAKHRQDSMQWMIKKLPESAGINPKYLRDLGPYEWKYAYQPGKAVLFEHQNKTALIMPINCDPNWNKKN
jgi:hypothetical protein